MSNQEGDVHLIQTSNGGEISVLNGVLEMAGGLETSVYLALFGGNEDDNAQQNNPFNWWGNIGEIEERQYRSRTQNLLRSLVAVPINLRRIEDAAINDLSYLSELKITNVVEVLATMPALNTINISITIQANGVETEFNFTNNWKALAHDFAVISTPSESLETSPPIVLNYEQTIKADFPIAYWRYGESSGIVAVEEISARNGQYIAAPNLGAVGLIANDSDTAVNLNGTTQYITVPDDSIFSFGDGVTRSPFSLEAWINLGASTSDPIISKKEIGGAIENEYIFHVSGSGLLRLVLYPGNTSSVEVMASTIPQTPQGITHHVVATYGVAANSGLLFVNGASVPVTFTGSLIMQNTPAALTVGHEGHPADFNRLDGVVDEVAIYDYVLTPAQILAHYNKGI